MKTAPIVTHKGISVYHTTDSKHPDMLREFTLATRNGVTDAHDQAFDVRDLPGYDGPTGIIILETTASTPTRVLSNGPVRVLSNGPRVQFDLKKFLKQAIDRGHLRRGGRIHTTA